MNSFEKNSMLSDSQPALDCFEEGLLKSNLIIFHYKVKATTRWASKAKKNNITTH